MFPVQRLFPLRLAVRHLRQRPGFTLIAIASLTIAIAANTTLFSLLDSLVISHQPYGDVDQLVELYTVQDGFATSPFSYPDFEDLRDATEELFDGVMLAGLAQAQADTDAGEVETLVAELITVNTLDVLRLRPALGRSFQPDEGIEFGPSPVVMLSYDHWQSRYGGDPDVLGRALRLNGQSYTIVGVAPVELPGTIRGFRSQIFLPLANDGAMSTDGAGRFDSRGSHWAFARGRLAPGVSLSRVQTALETIAADIKATHPEDWEDKSNFRALPTTSVIVNPTIDPFVKAGGIALMTLVLLVLAIACANLAGFLLARSTDQRREVAIRTSLGAPRGTLIRQQLIEAGLLTGISATLAVVASRFAIQAITNAQLPGVPIGFEAELNARVLLFVLFVAALATLLFGLAPALHSTRLTPASVLKDEAAGGAQRQRLRAVMVVAQVAVCTALVAGSGLFLRSLGKMEAFDPGFGQHPTGLLSIGLRSTDYPTAEERSRFLAELETEIGRMAGVQAVGAIDNLHLNLGNQQGLRVLVDGVEPPAGRTYHAVDYAATSNNFFRAAGVGLIAGRTFDLSDRAGSPRSVVVNHAFVERFFPGSTPTEALGRIVRRSGRTGADGELTIIGVTADTSVRLMGDAGLPFLYLAFDQFDRSAMTLLATLEPDASASSSAELAARMLATARRLDPELLILEAKTMNDHLGLQRLPARVLAVAFATFAALGLLLAAIGLYGVVAYAAAAREREVGIRRSLGATSGHVVGLLMHSGLRLVAVGAVLGLAVAFACGRLLSNLMFGVDGSDPLVLGGTAVVLLLVGALATLWPARRALSVHPATALRG